jgi:murein DD-endopeptidase MepM/ murein hydrolase activator NlpD
LLNATVGVHRVLGLLRPDPNRRSARATIHRRSSALARRTHARLAHLAGIFAFGPAQPSRQAHPIVRVHRVRYGAHRARIVERVHPTSIADGLRVRASGLITRRIGREQIVPLTVAALVLGAAVVSVPASSVVSAATGGVDGPGATPRIAVGGSDGGGVTLQAGKLDWVQIDPGPGVEPGPEPTPGDRSTIGSARLNAEADADAPIVQGPFLADGTLLKPVAVDTTVEDGKDLLRQYRVRAGDTLTGIAHHFGVSMMTVWWANGLKSKDDLHIGQTLVIPPMNGVVMTVKDGDTLESIAAATGGDVQEIITVNGLERPDLIVGQTLIVPDVLGKAIATPKPARPASRLTTTRSSGGTTPRPPARYTGGAFAWPVSGGYISQYFHYGHYGIDIAADYGTRVKAAAGGTVTFAGWKSNGGGYQVWIAHGSGLYTTYNHMSAVSVSRGQRVARGQAVGRIGSSGWATGPHLHFEVWRGPVWDGGSRVNPLAYL